MPTAIAGSEKKNTDVLITFMERRCLCLGTDEAIGTLEFSGKISTARSVRGSGREWTRAAARSVTDKSRRSQSGGG